MLLKQKKTNIWSSPEVAIAHKRPDMRAMGLIRPRHSCNNIEVRLIPPLSYLEHVTAVELLDCFRPMQYNKDIGRKSQSKPRISHSSDVPQ